jgi:uracil-DNA glycosylase
MIVPVGSLAARRFLGKVRLSDVVGTVAQGSEGHLIVPLPHPSGVNLWLNRRENQERVTEALANLQRLRQELRL